MTGINPAISLASILCFAKYFLSKPIKLVKYPPAEFPETKIKFLSPPYFSILLNTQATDSAASSIYLGALTLGLNL